MNKKLLFLFAIISTLTLFSCTTESLAESDSLYETQSTEGEDDPNNENPEGSN